MRLLYLCLHFCRWSLIQLLIGIGRQNEPVAFFLFASENYQLETSSHIVRIF